MNLMWKFHHVDGWSQVEDVMEPWPPNTTADDHLKSIGYRLVDKYGASCSDDIEVWRRHDVPRYLIFINFCDDWDAIVAPELPDLVELIQKLMPLGIVQLLREIEHNSDSCRIVAEELPEFRQHERRDRALVQRLQERPK